MPKQLAKHQPSLTQLPQANIVSPPSSSPLEAIYRNPAFQLARDNNVSFHIAENLINLRKFRKKSQAEVAKAAGTSQSAIARIESGEENITVGTLRKLIVALRGRFHIWIAPEELPLPRLPGWWDMSTT